jgi:hypothetical protein
MNLHYTYGNKKTFHDSIMIVALMEREKQYFGDDKKALKQKVNGEWIKYENTKGPFKKA